MIVSLFVPNLMLYPSGRVTLKLESSKQQTNNQAIMAGHSTDCPEAGQLGRLAGIHDEDLESRLEWLCSEARLRIDNLTAAVPSPKMKCATLDEIRHQQKVTKGLVLSLIREVENAVDAYTDEAYDEGEIEKVSGLGEDPIQEADDWLEDLDQAWSIIRSKKS